MAKDIYTIVGESVRRERARAKLTVEQLAESAGISTSFLSYIETRGRKASLRTIQKLAEALRVPIADLFKGAPAMEKDAVYDAAQQFSQLVRDSDATQTAAILDVVRAMSKSSGRSKKRPRR